MVRNTEKTKTTFSLVPPFIPGSTSLLCSQLHRLPSGPHVLQRDGNGGCGQSITLHLCRSFPLTLFPCSSMGFCTGCTVEICSTMVFTMGCRGESLLWRLEHPLPLLLLWPCTSLTIFPHSSLPCIIFELS